MKKTMVSVTMDNATMSKLAKLYHAKNKATKDYEDFTNELKELITTGEIDTPYDESCILTTKNNGIQCTLKVSFNLDKNIISKEDAKKIEDLENEIKAIKAKYDKTTKIMSFQSFK